MNYRDDEKSFFLVGLLISLVCQFFVQLLFVPSSQLGQKRFGRLGLVVLLALVTRLGVEAKEQDANVFVQLVPISVEKKNTQ